MTLFLQFVANGAVSGGLVALMALGFGLVYGTTRVFHVAQGAIFTFSSYVLYQAVAKAGLPATVGIGLALVAGATLGVLIDLLVYLPLARSGATPAVSMLSSFGLYIVIVNVIAMVFGTDTKMILLSSQSTYRFSGIVLTAAQVVAMVAFAIVAAVAVCSIRYTRLGWRIRAMRDNQTLYSAIGLDPILLRLAVAGVAGALAALGSCLAALDTGIEPNMGMAAVLFAAVAVIVGGIRVFAGALIGGLVVGLLQNLAIWKLSSQWQVTVTFSLLLLFLLVRPSGILRDRRRVEDA